MFVKYLSKASSKLLSVSYCFPSWILKIKGVNSVYTLTSYVWGCYYSTFYSSVFFSYINLFYIFF